MPWNHVFGREAELQETRASKKAMALLEASKEEEQEEAAGSGSESDDEQAASAALIVLVCEEVDLFVAKAVARGEAALASEGGAGAVLKPEHRLAIDKMGAATEHVVAQFPRSPDHQHVVDILRERQFKAVQEGTLPGDTLEAHYAFCNATERGERIVAYRSTHHGRDSPAFEACGIPYREAPKAAAAAGDDDADEDASDESSSEESDSGERDDSDAEEVIVEMREAVEVHTTGQRRRCVVM